MTVVVIACFTIILDISSKISCNQFFNITAAATDDLYPLSFKDILCTLTHIAGQHDRYAHLSQNRSDTAFASTAFRGSHLAHTCNLSINDVKYCIVCAMTEVIIYAPVSRRYCYLHITIF